MGFYILFPGVRPDEKDDGENNATGKPLFNNYDKGVDVLIVGRGIIGSDNMLEECEKYRLEGWNNYKISENNILLLYYIEMTTPLL